MKSKNPSSYDILFIDKKIKKKIEDDKENIHKIIEQKNKLERKLKRTKSYKDRNDIMKKIDDMQTYIRDMESDYHLSMYITRTIHIVNEYESLLDKVVEKDFVSGKTKNINDAEINKHKKECLIDEYIKIAKEYIDIPPIQCKVKKIDNLCNGCGSGNGLIENTDYSTVCFNCGNEMILIKNKPTYKDIDRVNITAKYKYDRISHFKDIMNKFQAKQTNTIPDKVFDYINKQLESHGLLIDSKDNVLKYSKVKKSHILMFLKEGGFSEHYDDCIYIYCTITFTKPPNITHIEEEIMNDFKLLISTYNSIKNQENTICKKRRKNFLNSQYILYQLLRKHKYDCKKEDFNILKTRDRRIEHDEVYMKLCEKLKWTFRSTI